MNALAFGQWWHNLQEVNVLIRSGQCDRIYCLADCLKRSSIVCTAKHCMRL